MIYTLPGRLIFAAATLLLVFWLFWRSCPCELVAGPALPGPVNTEQLRTGALPTLPGCANWR
jgi:hypothetical protein